MVDIISFVQIQLLSFHQASRLDEIANICIIHKNVAKNALNHLQQDHVLQLTNGSYLSSAVKSGSVGF